MLFLFLIPVHVVVVFYTVLFRRSYGEYTGDCNSTNIVNSLKQSFVVVHFIPPSHFLLLFFVVVVLVSFILILTRSYLVQFPYFPYINVIVYSIFCSFFFSLLQYAINFHVAYFRCSELFHPNRLIHYTRTVIHFRCHS